LEIQDKKAQFIVKLDSDDHLRFTALGLLHRIVNSTLIKLSLGFLLLSWLLSYFFIKPFSLQNAEVFLLLALTIFTLIFIPVFLLVRSKLDFDQLRHLRGETLWTFSNNGFIMQSESSAAQNNWSLVAEVMEGPHDFYLYQINGLAFDIPKSSFQNPALQEDFKDILRTNLGAKAKFLK
jgi:hypothetical protein